MKTYEQWLRRYLRFHGLRHPREMGSAEVNAFLTHLVSRPRNLRAKALELLQDRICSGSPAERS
ncbi:MAG: phage integrase N-terminal SAM-like domain-containing protein [Cyanobacteriota bacterium]